MTDEADEPTRRIVRRPLEDPTRTRHTALPATWLAVSTDIGQRHHTNQDAQAVAVVSEDDRIGVMVISDGVSSSVGAERASHTAATTVRDLLVAAAQPSLPEDPTALFSDAFHRANQAVLADGADGSPVGSCTLIAAIAESDRLHVANIGDTRAYWLPDQGEPAQLSVDDSMAQAQMEMGISREAAETGIHAHAITKWLGPEAPDVTPRTASFLASASGFLLVCSDGLWNYASEATDMADLVRQIWASMPPESGLDVLAHALTRWANAQGGRDNITVAVARIG